MTVANPQRGVTRETTSNSAGEYTVAKVPIGNYEITAEAPGFQKLLRTGITLTVGQTLRVDLTANCRGGHPGSYCYLGKHGH